MGSYPLDVLIRKWQLEELTVEQVIGQILQVLLEPARQVEKLEEKIK